MQCEGIVEIVFQRKMVMKIRTYSELRQLDTFEERFDYLKLDGVVGLDTFGSDRIFNQKFYKSSEWRRLRNEIILRDNGCDLGMEDFEIHGKIIIHHMNPITIYDINQNIEDVLNPEYLICVSHNTHNAIHYGDKDLLSIKPNERLPGDTCPWR